VNIVNAQSAVSLTHKSDRTCQYCNKEFKYPYMYKLHKKTKCWINGELSKLNDESIKLNDESIKLNDKTTVPIRLSLA
jgi:hypothetical protein